MIVFQREDFRESNALEEDGDLLRLVLSVWKLQNGNIKGVFPPAGHCEER
jgi:hypothetical protein